MSGVGVRISSRAAWCFLFLLRWGPGLLPLLLPCGFERVLMGCQMRCS